jgi:tetratricopeptide (TPR) repeat protein
MAHTTDCWSRRPPRIRAFLMLAACCCAVVSGLAAARAVTGRADLADARRDPGDGGMLLVEYFRLLVADENLEAFRGRVAARYSEEMLCRLLSQAPGITTRRAAAAALGSMGSFRRSNPVLGRALSDTDPVVRNLAEGALWAIWFRADTPENNGTLRQVIQLAGQGEMKRAETLASRLIAVAPGFAEAYNQRAIIYFEQGRFAESAQDCQRVLSINPYHFGALGGLFQCQIQLDRPVEALKTLRKASKLQPHNMKFRETIRQLETRVNLDG